MGWIIAGAIVLFFVLLLAGRVSVFFDYNGQLALKIKYMCFTIIKMPKKKRVKKPKKSRPSKKKEKKNDISAETADDKADGKSDKKDDNDKDKKDDKGKKNKKSKDDGKKKFDLKSLTFDDILALLKLAFSGVGKPLRKLFKSIKVSHMSIRIVCGGSDAAVTGIKYGAINAVVGNVLGLLDSFFTLKPLDDLYITADFQSEETLYDIYFEVRLTLFAAVAAGFRLIKAFLKVYKDMKKRQKNNKRVRAGEASAGTK